MIPLTFNFKHALIAGTIFVAFSAGWVVNGWRHDANLKEALQDKVELQKAYDDYAREVAAKFQNQQAAQTIVYRDLKRKVQDVTDNRICFADNNALQLWNDALTGMPNTTTGTAKTTTSASTAITDEQVITNAIENFEQAKAMRDQLNALIDWYETNR
jgi:hypothetical protein